MKETTWFQMSPYALTVSRVRTKTTMSHVVLSIVIAILVLLANYYNFE